ncbi:MAG TPA: 3'(2'),5'-bisphosphate nucleotidase CysQ [Pseudohongiella sp.]|nr:3'(2'),5'-bisphosphate nucleotidase CysQ [Pseudohongiella sp.]
MLLTPELLQTVAFIAQRAGAEIMDVYSRPSQPEVISKADDSPLTEADLRANTLIVEALQTLESQLPVLSEESAQVPFDERCRWQRFWLVDPLDGTREFISRNGEFTVNIALIDDGQPVLGVVHVPVSGVTYLGLVGDMGGAWRIDADGSRHRIQKAALPAVEQWKSCVLRVVASRRHGGAEIEALLTQLSGHFADIEKVSMGSSLKICLLAEGKADLYPRLAPTSEWDTAAAHAVLKAAGGEIFDQSLEVLEYNRKAGMLNPYFLASADTSAPWISLLHEINSPRQ